MQNVYKFLVNWFKMTATLPITFAGGKGLPEAQENRNFVVSKMSREIHELMRVLQLTTYDEDDWNTDDLTIMRKALSNIAGSMGSAMDWLSNPNAEAGGLGKFY